MFFSGKELYSYLRANGYDSSYVSAYFRNQAQKVRAALRDAGMNANEIMPEELTAADYNIAGKNSPAQRFMRGMNEFLTLRHDVGRSRLRDYGYSKWLRPWVVVQKIKDMTAPQGDYLIGVEVETGWYTPAAAQFIAKRMKSWKYMTIDTEGGRNGMEVTFPPVLYSKFNKNSKAWKFLSMAKHPDSGWLQYNNSTETGTHINVSGPGHRVWYNSTQMQERVSWMHRILQYQLSPEECYRYFNRRPYNGVNLQSNLCEFKLFQSVNNPKQLVKYVEVAVALYKLLEDLTVEIDARTVRDALELGYQIACRKTRIRPELRIPHESLLPGAEGSIELVIPEAAEVPHEEPEPAQTVQRQAA